MKLQHVKKLYFYVKKPFFFFSILKQLNKDQSQLVFIFLESLVRAGSWHAKCCKYVCLHVCVSLSSSERLL